MMRQPTFLCSPIGSTSFPRSAVTTHRDDSRISFAVCLTTTSATTNTKSFAAHRRSLSTPSHSLPRFVYTTKEGDARRGEAICFPSNWIESRSCLPGACVPVLGNLRINQRYRRKSSSSTISFSLPACPFGLSLSTVVYLNLFHPISSSSICLDARRSFQHL